MDERRTFHAGAFFAALDAEREARGVTWKRVAGDTGVSASTLTRIGQGRKPDVDTLAALSTWAGLDPKDFMRGKRDKEQPETLAMISTYLRGDPHLTEASASALEEIIKVSYESLRRNDAPAERVQERSK
jgi:transcriptional regulator with XRE-family HTH domain